MENQNIVYLVCVGLKLQNISVVHAVITCLGVVVHRGIGGEILKMRCKICEKVVKCANVPTRTRMICGNPCLQSIKTIVKTLDISEILINNG